LFSVVDHDKGDPRGVRVAMAEDLAGQLGRDLPLRLRPAAVELFSALAGWRCRPCTVALGAGR